MIAAMILAAAMPEPQGYTPEEAKAVLAIMMCEKSYLDSLPAAERHERGDALIDVASAKCGTEEEALRTLLKARFNPPSAERAMEIVRQTMRERLPAYIRR